MRYIAIGIGTFVITLASLVWAQAPKEQVQTKDQIHSAIIGQSRAVCEMNLSALAEENAQLKQEIRKMKEPLTKEEKK